MSYEFSIGWFFIGIVIVIVATIALRFHQQIADNLGSGVSDYERYRMWALIALGMGFVVMLNLHGLILKTLLGNVFPHQP